MNKAEFLTAVQGKPGFVKVIDDKTAQDNVQGQEPQKKYLVVEHTNTDGTSGITNVFYLHNTTTDEAKFYNVEPASFDLREPGSEAKKELALRAYLEGKYQAFFINRIDYINNWAEADVYSLNVDKLTKKTVVVYKKTGQPIADIDVI